MSSSTLQYLRRMTVDETRNDDLSFTTPNATDFLDSSSQRESSFDPKVFWSVNGFIFLLLSVVVLWCCFGNKDWWINSERRRRETDAEYQQSLADRQRQQDQAKVQSPEKRKQKLLQSFKRHGVEMTVSADDLIDEDPSSADDLEASSGSSDSLHTGQLKLPNGTVVPNCCAICLGSYSVGDPVVWSSNSKCQHAFHQNCVVGWLVKMQPETPCPCCRQEFTDLVELRKERKITWSGDTFDLGAIGF